MSAKSNQCVDKTLDQSSQLGVYLPVCVIIQGGILPSTIELNLN